MAPADPATQTPSDANAPQTPSPDATTLVPPQGEKDWKEEYARLRKDYDVKSAEAKRLKRAIIDDTQPEPETKPTPQPVTTADLEQVKWELSNQAKIDLARDEFEKYKSKGIPRDESLRLALNDKGFTSDKSVAERLRQSQMSSAPSSVDRMGGPEGDDDATPVLTDMDRRMGITPEMKKKWGKKAKDLILESGTF